MSNSISHTQYMECINKAISERRGIESDCFKDISDIDLINLIMAFSWHRERINAN